MTVSGTLAGDPEEAWRPFEEVSSALRAYQSAVYLRLDAARLAAPSYVPHPHPRLEFSGDGLPSVLAHLALNRPDDFAELQDNLRSVVPAVKRIRFERQPVTLHDQEPSAVTGFSRRPPGQEYMGDALVFDFQGADGIPAHMASEGTLLVLGLLAVLFGPARPGLVLFDDLDQGLHPLAQRELMLRLQSLPGRNPGLQIVATTHSPYLVDYLRPEHLRVTARTADGTFACARLEDHPEFSRWRDEMTPGEFWGSVGEDWVREQEAARMS